MSQLELAFIILGTIFIIMSSLQIAKEHKKRKVCSDSVYAKVTEIKQKGKGYLKVFWYPVYTFRFKGRIFQRRDRKGSSHQRNYIGQHVQLYVNPNNVNQFFVRSESREKIYFTLLLVGIILVLVGIAVKIISLVWKLDKVLAFSTY